MELKFWTEIKEDKIRGLKTLITCLCYICIGYQGSVVGVSLNDLKILASCNLSEVSLLLTGGAIGYASGSVVAGFMESKFNPQLVMAIAMGATAAVQMVFPFITSLIVMIILSVGSGLFCGIVDCFSNIFVLKLWAKECPPFLQALHFSFGVGSFIAPLVTGPFLKEVSEEQGALRGNDTSNVTIIEPKPEDIQLFIPFGINFLGDALTSLALFYLYFNYRETVDHPSRTAGADKSETERNQNSVTKKLNPKVRIVVIMLAAIFLLFYTGLEQTFGHLLPAYAHDGPLGLLKETGAQIASVFWITYTCFRLVAVLLSGVIGTEAMLTFNTIATVIASITLCAVQTSVPAFWFSSALLGVALSSTWGSLFGYLESQFPVHGKVVAALTVGAAIGASLTPAVIGYLMGIYITAFAWFPLILSSITAIIFLLIFLICKLYLNTEVKTERREFKTQVSVVSQQSIGAVIFVAKDVKH